MSIATILTPPSVTGQQGFSSFSLGLPGQLRLYEVTLTDAQVKALNATPVELVPAPGIGKLLVPYGPIIATGNVSVVYSVTRAGQLRYGAAGTVLTSTITMTTSTTLGAFTSMPTFAYPSGLALDNSNLNLQLFMAATPGPLGATVAGTKLSILCAILNILR